ncbi:RNA-dependent RNA polymerase [Genoa virus]|uniref:RNA-directed RNA polymerase n=1 Tax=Genoa virus TaxID=2485870 RepID=A0A3G3BTF8_9VIRU|nr:RNA-dependent RNA polymerase [Genoa virus]AYP67566.1 RNA-dependent RNA polymerase [Genoa virus]
MSFDESQKAVPLSPHELVYERKFDTALRMSHGVALMKRQKNDEPSLDDQFLFAAASKAHMDANWSEWKFNRHAYVMVLRSIEGNCKSVHDDPNTVRAARIASEVVKCQTMWNESSQMDDARESITGYSEFCQKRWLSQGFLTRLLEGKHLLDDLTKALAKGNRRRNRDESLDSWIEDVSKDCFWICKELDMKVCWSRNSLLLEIHDTSYVFPKPYAIMIHNKICDIISVLLYACATPPEVYGEDILAITVKFIECWSNMANKYQQKFFNISKLLEAICIGETLKEVEGTGNADFLDTVAAGMLEGAQFVYEGSHLQQIIRNSPIPIRHELSCLSKIMGHPFCDVVAGARALQERVNEQKLIDVDCVSKCVLYAKEDFIRKFLQKEKKWPLVSLDPRCPKSLVQACMRNVDPRNTLHQQKWGKIELRDFHHVTILKNMSFDWVENFLPYIKDRTISLPKSDVLIKFIKRDPDFKSDWKKTRLLLYYLLWPETETSHIPYLKAFAEGDWEQLANYMVIRIVPKEKEHKIEARGFGCKTSHDRARTIIQEMNVARFLDDYSDEHVMTLGEIALAKKLLGFRKLQNAYKGYKMIILSVDASSWNNRFRHETVAPVAEAVLDNVFDVPVFSKTHQAYEKSFVYNPDIEEVIYWDGQLGGIEGLNQDTWVFVYVHQIKVCLEKHPYPYYILCKGDDLRVAIMVPPTTLQKTTMTELKRKILGSVSETGAKFGHVIKVEDSYASECYFAYSKNAFVSEVEQPQAYRKVQKCYGANNAFLTTVDDYVGSAFSNAHSTSKTSPSPLSCYATACYWAAESLTTHDTYKHMSDYQLVALLQIPNMVGGFPIIYLHNFFVRAESDLFPPYIDLCQTMLKLHPEVGECLTKFLCQVKSNVNKSLAGLFTDPYSLPISRPKPAVTLLRQQMTNIIKGRTKNKYIRQLFSIMNKKFERHMLDCFSTSNVYNVKLMAAVFDCTPEAIIREMIRKFESGRSIYDCMVLNRGRSYAIRILGRCAQAEARLHDYRRQIMCSKLHGSRNILNEGWKELCPFLVAQECRTEMWDKPVEGITQPPLQHMMCYGTPKSWKASDYAADNHFELWFDKPEKDVKAPCFTVGTHDPFVGASTGRGLAPPEARFVANNILTSKVRVLMDLYKWSHMTQLLGGKVVVSNLPSLIGHMLLGYTDKSMDQLLPFGGQRVLTRTTQHHVRVNNFRASIVPNTLQNVYTRVTGNSRSHRVVESSSEHYRINFLHVYTYGVSLWSLPWWAGRQPDLPTRVWLVTTPCVHCMKPIKEHPVVLQYTSLPDMSLPTETTIGEVALQELQAELLNFNPKQYYVPVEDIDGMSSEEAHIGLIQGLMNQLWRDREKLQMLYTGHHLSLEGLSALQNWTYKTSDIEVSDSDLRGVPLDSILQDLAFMVFAEIVCRYKTASIRSISVALGNIPGEELPWYPVLLLLDRAGLFYSLQKVIRERLPGLRHAYMDNPRTYAPLFGTACYELSTSLPITARIAHLSYTEDPIVSKEFIRRLWGIRWMMLDRFYKPMFEAMGRLTDETQDTVIMSFLSGIIINDEALELTKSKSEPAKSSMEVFPQQDDLDDFIEACMVPKADLYPMCEDEGEEFVPPKYLEVTCERYGIPASMIYSFIRTCPPQSDEFTEMRKHFDMSVPEQTIEVFRTDIVTCVNRIRFTQMDEGIPTIQRVGPTTDFPSHIKIKGVRRCVMSSFRAEHTFTYDATQGISGYSLDVEWDCTEFNVRWTARPLGMGNISMSKAVGVLSALGLSKLPDRLSAVCLGDGYGGYTAVVAGMTQGGRVVYNTMPNRRGTNPLPVAGLEAAGRTNSVIEYSDIARGHYDLAEAVTLMMMEKHTSVAGLVVLDAEPSPIVSSERVAMLHNVVTFFLRVGQKGSVLIMKVYITEFLQWAGVIGKLSPRCRVCGVLQCKASALDGEFFLVAQLDTPDNNSEYEVQPRYPPVRDMTHLRRMCDRYIKSLLKDDGGTNNLTLIHEFPGFVKSLAKFLPLHGWSKLQEVCRVYVPETCVHRVARSVPTWISEIIKVLVDCEEQCLGELEGNHPDKSCQTYNTLRHTVVLTDRYLRISGFKYVSTLYLAGVQSLTQRSYRSGYLKSVLKLPRRLPFVLQPEEHFTTPPVVSGKMFDMVGCWKLGVRWGVSGLNISYQT